MSSKVTIKELVTEKLEKLNIKCVDCSFWFDRNGVSLLHEISSIKSMSDAGYILRSKLAGRDYRDQDRKKLSVFSDNGGIVKVAFINRRCAGILVAGICELFPKLRTFRVYPVDQDSIFLGCIFVEQDYRGLGIRKRLLIELEKDLLKKDITAIEAIGKRLDDDIDEEEFENSPLLSFKFLLNNGFCLRKNDEHYPLVRLELKNIAGDFSEEGLFSDDLRYKKSVRHPVIIRGNRDQ